MAYRCDDPTKSSNENGPGKDGYSESTPGGTPTTIRADHLNMFQEEPCNAIEAAGFTLNKNDNYQLLKAIRMQCAKNAVRLQLGEDTGASQTLLGIARKARAVETMTAAELMVVGESGTIFRSLGGEFVSITPGSSFADTFFAIVYDASLNLWLACGADGEIQSIATATATRRNTGGTDDLLAIATDGAAKSVAVGQNGLIKYTVNGTAWSTGTDPTGGDDLHTITFGAGLFVICADSGIYTSPTGQTWTLRLTGLVADVTSTNRIVYDATIGFICFVPNMVSSWSVFHSPDGITWTEILEQIGPSSFGAVGAIVFAGPYCWGMARSITNGTSVRVYFSTDVNPAPYFDCDLVAPEGMTAITVLDGQIFALFEDKIYVGGAL